jgi:hypothetical protein
LIAPQTQVELEETNMMLEGYTDDDHNATTIVSDRADADTASVTDSEDFECPYDVFQDEYTDPLYAIYAQYKRVFKHLQQYTGGCTLTLD